MDTTRRWPWVLGVWVLGIGVSSACGGGDSDGPGSGPSAPAGAGSVSGGSTSVGGSTGASGASESLGGVESSGGTNGLATGGVAGSGGSATGGSADTGGDPATGGSVTGGVPSTGGIAATAGSPTGGVASTGGTSVTGGSATGGNADTGGTPASGGSATGGSAGAGGEAFTPLANYGLVSGPIALGNLQDCSGVTWKPETDTFFVVANTVHLLYEYSADFQDQLRTISLDNGPVDTEDVAYLGADRFAVVVEDNEVYVVTVDSVATTVDMGGADVERYVVSAPPSTTNLGFEGVTLRPEAGGLGRFFVCQEGGGTVPIRVSNFPRMDAAGTYSYADATLTVSEPWDAPTLLGSQAVDLSSLTYDEESDTLLVLSHESSRILRVVPDTGQILETRDLSTSPQYEGVTYASGGRLVLVSEPNWVEIYQLD